MAFDDEPANLDEADTEVNVDIDVKAPTKEEAESIVGRTTDAIVDANTPTQNEDLDEVAPAFREAGTRHYDAAEGFTVAVNGDRSVDFVTNNDVIHLSEAQWHKTVSSTALVRGSPQFANILDFILNADHKWVDWLSNEVEQARDMYDLPPVPEA